jgi:hypothetical protein
LKDQEAMAVPPTQSFLARVKRSITFTAPEIRLRSSWADGMFRNLMNSEAVLKTSTVRLMPPPLSSFRNVDLQLVFSRKQSAGPLLDILLV